MTGVDATEDDKVAAIEAGEGGAAAPAADLPLDPFGHLPGISSRITGLGGIAPGHDPSYVFHTTYVEVAPGRARFTVRFEELTARRGTLVLRVHMLPKEEGAHAILSTSMRVQLNRLIEGGGSVDVHFEAFANVTYALYASLPGETDAEARAVSITLDRPAGAAATAEFVVDARTTAFGREAARPTPRLISLERATLAAPVSQIATGAQLREAAFAEWRSLLGPAGDPAEAWSAAYVAQVLAQYGMLAAGAHGLGFCAAGDPLAAALAKRNLAIDVIDPDAPDHAGGGNLHVRALDPQNLAADVVNHDFSWSRGLAGRLGSLRDGAYFIEDAVARLRPGGLGVHVLPYNLDAEEDTVEKGDVVLFRRRDLERLALVFISRGHEVAQIKLDSARAPLADFGAPLPYRATYCGLVVRKAATVM